MARAKKVNNPVYHLELTVQEANWLKVNLQNPLHGQEAHMEDSASTTHRSAIFGTLFNVVESVQGDN